MIPHRLSYLLQNEIKSNLFENQEVLRGQTMCDYIINNPSNLKQILDTCEHNHHQRLSIIEEFLAQIKSDSNDDPTRRCLRTNDLINKSNLIVNDLFHSNPLQKCFEFKD